MPDIPETLFPIILALGGVLCLATLAGLLLKARTQTKKLGQDVFSRTLAWWVMVAIIIGCCWHSSLALTICFGLVSFQGLREYFGVMRVRRADQRALFWSIFAILPLQYLFVEISWYGMFAIFIPTYGFVAISIFTIIRGDAQDFLARSAKIFYGLIIVVYFISHIPMLPALELLDQDGGLFQHRYGELVLFLLIVSQGNDVSQYIWGKSLGKHKISPNISPNKTWEGFIGGVLSSAAIAMLLSWLIPFNLWQSACLGVGIACLGFAGDIIMSAIKRDAGIKDYGQLLGGHGGILDRVDGLAIAAPIYFHMLRYYAGT